MHQFWRVYIFRLDKYLIILMPYCKSAVWFVTIIIINDDYGDDDDGGNDGGDSIDTQSCMALALQVYRK